MTATLAIAMLVFGWGGALTSGGVDREGAQAAVPIFVGPQTRDGFIDVDSGIAESIKDIQNEVKKSRLFSIVGSAQEATIVLRIVGRRLAGEAYSVGINAPGATLGGGTVAGVKQPAYSMPGTTVSVPIFRYAIDTVLAVGAYEKPTTSIDEGGSWKGAAKQVVKDLTVWVEANRGQLVKR